MRSIMALLKQSGAGLRVLLAMTVITGILYPAVVWGGSQVPGLQHQANGSIVMLNGQAVGSSLIGINLTDPAAANDPTKDKYFEGRPYMGPNASKDSNGNYPPFAPSDPSASGGSNMAADSQALTDLIKQRKDIIAKREGVDPSMVPPDAVTASASGLDPNISPAYANLQVARVARNNGLSQQQVQAIVDKLVQGRPLGILGDPTVNVLDLNLAVQQAAGK
jgi:potassium-transporting ATPase KdpC subunit